MFHFTYLFLAFIFSAFIGWSIETILNSIDNKKFMNRGFLIGPICPIYGFGTILAITLFDSIKDNYLLVFIISLVGGTIIEYFISILLEKIFHIRWWDYSSFKFNFQGRICLIYAFVFGLGGIIIELLYPLVYSIFDLVPFNILCIIAIILFIIFCMDIIITNRILKKIDLRRIKNDEDNSHLVKGFLYKIVLKKVVKNMDIFIDTMNKLKDKISN